MTQNSIGVLAPDDTHLPPCGNFWCGGHSDESTLTSHSSPWEYFGALGVAITREGDSPSMVSLIDLDSPQADFNVADARLLALQLLQAADLAERANATVTTEPVTARLAELLSTAG